MENENVVDHEKSFLKRWFNLVTSNLYGVDISDQEFGSEMDIAFIALGKHSTSMRLGYSSLSCEW